MTTTYLSQRKIDAREPQTLRLFNLAVELNRLSNNEHSIVFVETTAVPKKIQDRVPCITYSEGGSTKLALRDGAVNILSGLISEYQRAAAQRRRAPAPSMPGPQMRPGYPGMMHPGGHPGGGMMPPSGSYPGGGYPGGGYPGGGYPDSGHPAMMPPGGMPPRDSRTPMFTPRQPSGPVAGPPPPSSGPPPSSDSKTTSPLEEYFGGIGYGGYFAEENSTVSTSWAPYPIEKRPDFQEGMLTSAMPVVREREYYYR